MVGLEFKFRSSNKKPMHQTSLSTQPKDCYSRKMKLTYISILTKTVEKYRELPQLTYLEQQNTVIESNLVRRQTRKTTEVELSEKCDKMELGTTDTSLHYLDSVKFGRISFIVVQSQSRV